MKTKTLLIALVLFFSTITQTKAQYWKDVFSPVQVTTIKVYGNIVWVGTLSGAYKFDLNGNFQQRIGGEILSLAKDNNDKMWFGTYNDGVFSFQNNIINRYDTINGLVSNHICAMACDLQGNMWFGSIDGFVSKFDGSQFVNYTSTHELFLKPISDIIIDRAGVVFIGQYLEDHPTADYYSGVSRYDGTWHKDTMERVYSLATDQQGVVWCVGGFKIRKWNGASWIYIPSSPTIPQNKEIYEVACDSLGNIWFATDQNHYSFNGTSWQTFSINNGMPNDRMFVIAFDSLNQRWIGGSNNVNEFNIGLYRYQNSNLHSFPWMPDHIPTLYNGIVSDNSGKIWLPSHHLLSYIYPIIDTAINIDGSNIITCVAKDNSGKIWAASTDTIYYQNGNLWNSIPISNSFMGNLTSNITFDISNNPIISFMNSIQKYNNSSWTAVGGDLPSYISSMAVDATNAIWIGTTAHGVYQFDGTNLIQFSGSNLQSDTVNDVFIDHQEALWIATNNGISKFHNNIWTQFSTSDGLVNNNVTKIYQDAGNKYWFATDDGISMYDGSNWVSFNNPKGFIHHSNINGIAEDSEGNMWFSNNAGICRLSDDIVFVENKIKEDLKIGVFPNPTSDKLYLTNLNGSCTIQIYSINGTKIKTIKTNSNTEKIDIQHLSPGSYILEIVCSGKKSSLIFIKK
ncbi:MAG: two-component regulator propeller domain-containing protein [Bacteroidales bacterium]|nr:two-component regulator propeller domain-containing protein [Bacteroidales bacterium]